MKRIVWTSIAVALLVGVYSAVSLTRAGGVRVPVAPASPQAGGVQRIVSAQPFLLERAWRHVWRAEQPAFDAGWLVVLEVDPALVVPRNVEEPVLYAGSQTVERVNFGHGSGRVVAIIPSARDEHGNVALDLATTPMWFGDAMLPERVNAVRAADELARAVAKGVRPMVVPVAGELLRLPSRDELDERAAVLVLENAPDEADLGLGMLAPRVVPK
jgi:hypothetical protein